MDGGDGNDRLVAMGGRETMTGGLGADMFDFRRSSWEFTDADKIVDFQQGLDRIYIGYDQDAASIIAAARVTSVSLVLTIGEGNTVSLQGFKGTLTEADFIYG